MKKLTCILVLTTAVTLVSCQKKESTIDNHLQGKAVELLKKTLVKNVADAGCMAVMDIHTGEVLACYGVERSRDTCFTDNMSLLTAGRENALIMPISVLTALQSGKVSFRDTIDAYDGVYLVHGSELKDHNWRRGGYQVLSLEEGVQNRSNVIVYRAVQKAFGDSGKGFYEALQRMSYGKPDSIDGMVGMKPVEIVPGRSLTTFAWNVIGYEQKIAPMQMMAFYNAFLNDGKMIAPRLYKGDVEVINPKVADANYIKLMKRMLYDGTTYFCGPVGVRKPVEGYGFGVDVTTGGKNEKIADFCGYFPVEHPKYLIYVSLRKQEPPITWALGYDYACEVAKLLK
jgi:cell division protein FtsI (penicillin-binding protein 3)